MDKNADMDLEVVNQMDSILSNTKEIILEFIDIHKNEIMLFMDEVVKLVGFYEDSDDYYYDCIDSHGNLTHQSCVFTPLILKGKIDKLDYEFLENFFIMNSLKTFSL
jgi:hypothetical protein